jgi:bifunctional non-homologous end joining protein LigD
MKPMLAKVGDTSYLDKEGYIYEPKLDGVRAILSYGKKSTFTSRNGKDLTSKYANITLPRIYANSCLIDGEIVAYNSKGNPDFNLLENGGDAVFVAFDIIKKNGLDLRNKPLIERKKILKQTLCGNVSVQVIFYSEHGRKLWNLIKKRKAEGVIAKKKYSTYSDGRRSDSWLKIKITNTVDAIIVGFTQSKRMISSLALGLYDDGNIVFVGKVGTGFKSSFIDNFSKQLMKIKIKKRINNFPEEAIAVKPRYVAEVEYLEFTPNNKLRAPVFKRLRNDKKISECKFPV